MLIGGTQTVGNTTSFVAWTKAKNNRWHKAVVGPLGTSEDPGSNVTDVLVTDEGFYVAARLGEVLRLAYSVDGRRWQAIALPNAPTGVGGRAALAASGSSIVIVARSEAAGAVWSLPLR